MPTRDEPEVAEVARTLRNRWAPTGLVVGHFTDPEGNLIGVAETA